VDFPTELVVIPAIFIGLPWLILHYVTRWKTAATLTTGDEALLDDLYQLARRLEDRLETAERLIAAEHPDFRPARLGQEAQLPGQDFAELDRTVSKRGIR
jgi:phage shock protein B